MSQIREIHVTTPTYLTISAKRGVTDKARQLSYLGPDLKFVKKNYVITVFEAKKNMQKTLSSRHLLIHNKSA